MRILISPTARSSLMSISWPTTQAKRQATATWDTDCRAQAPTSSDTHRTRPAISGSWMTPPIEMWSTSRSVGSQQTCSRSFRRIRGGLLYHQKHSTERNLSKKKGLGMHRKLMYWVPYGCRLLIRSHQVIPCIQLVWNMVSGTKCSEHSLLKRINQKEVYSI